MPSFEEKLKKLQNLYVPLVKDLQNAEKSSISPLQKGTLEKFLQELDGIVRWTKREIYWTPERESYMLVNQKSKKFDIHETDLDHVIIMEEMVNSIFTDKKYESLQKVLSEAKIKNGILVHDGGEIDGIGDVTHADETVWKATHLERKEREHLTFTTFFRKHAVFQSLGEELEKELYQSYFDEEFELTTEGCFVVFLDRLQAVVYAFENIYPYEEIYRNPQTLQYYLREYILAPTVGVLRQLKEKRAREEFAEFLISELSLGNIARSYQKAEKVGKITKEEVITLTGAVEKILHDFYNNDVDIFLTAWNLAEESKNL